MSALPESPQATVPALYRNTAFLRPPYCGAPSSTLYVSSYVSRIASEHARVQAGYQLYPLQPCCDTCDTTYKIFDSGWAQIIVLN